MNIGSIFTPTGNWAAFNSTVNLSGTLRFNQGTNSWGSSTTAFNLGSTGSLYNRALSDVTINLGSLAGNSGSVLHGSDQAGPGVDTYVIGALNTSTSFAGAISDGSNGTSPHSVAITKVGTGSLTLNGASTYSGSTIVQGGTLIVGGSITSGSGSTIEVTSGTSLSLTGGSLTADSIVIDAGGSLSGGGSLNGALSVTNNGTITASTGGTFTMTGQVVNNGTLRLTNGTALNATGPFINNGTLDLTQGGQTLPANLVNNGQILYAPTNTDTPTMPEWALGILAMLLIFAAGPALTKKCA
jgi:autotransporter-associated beta strand protein